MRQELRPHAQFDIPSNRRKSPPSSWRSLAMERYFTMTVAQNASIAMGLLCPADSVCNHAMDMRVVVDRKGFVSGSEEENAAATTLERASTAKNLSSFIPG